MDKDAIFSDLCAALGIPAFGVCRWDSSLLKIPCRSKVPPKGAQTAIVCLFPYYVGDFPYRNLSRYAMVRDYHTVAMGLLNCLSAALSAALPGEVFYPLVDISPLDEVSLAVKAGLGIKGLHGQLIHQTFGSYVFIGEILTTAAFTPAAPLVGSCSLCGKCIAACPGGALQKSGLNRETCRSQLTQKKNLAAESERAAVQGGGMVWGCDICTDICPHNAHPAFSPIPAFYRQIAATVTEENLSEIFAGRAFSYKGQQLLRRNLALTRQRRAQNLLP